MWNGRFEAFRCDPGLGGHTMEQPMIFVFGSNLAGRHGKGAALHAKLHCGAVYGVGVGRTGGSYAIPTKDEYIKTLPLSIIAQHVADFITYARSNPELIFKVTRIGCGLAGYSDQEIAPMFDGATANCHLPEGWRTLATLAVPSQRQIQSK